MTTATSTWVDLFAVGDALDLFAGLVVCCSWQPCRSALQVWTFAWKCADALCGYYSSFYRVVGKVFAISTQRISHFAFGSVLVACLILHLVQFSSHLFTLLVILSTVLLLHVILASVLVACLIRVASDIVNSNAN